jgi:anti-sigma-K factor RskA
VFTASYKRCLQAIASSKNPEDLRSLALWLAEQDEQTKSIGVFLAVVRTLYDNPETPV